MFSKSIKKEPNAEFCKVVFSDTEFEKDLDNDSLYNKENEENDRPLYGPCEDVNSEKIHIDRKQNNETTTKGTNVNNNNSTSFKNFENLDKEFNMPINDINILGETIKDYQRFYEENVIFRTIEEDTIKKDFEYIEFLRQVQPKKDEIIPISQREKNPKTENSLFPKNLINEFEKKNILFLTNKRGRKPINSKKENIDIDNIHTKDEFLNIFKKQKRHAMENIRRFINEKLKESKNPNLNFLQLLKIDNSMIIVDRIDENLELFGKKLGEIFSQKPNSRFRKHDLFDNNIEAIKKIRLENYEFFNAILETTFGEIMDIYVGKSEDLNKKALFEGLKTIYDDIETFRKNGEDEGYINSYLEHGKNYLSIMLSKTSRKKKEKKIK